MGGLGLLALSSALCSAPADRQTPPDATARVEPTAATSVVVLEGTATTFDYEGYRSAIEDHVRSVGLSLAAAGPPREQPLAQAVAAGEDPTVLAVFWLQPRATEIAIYLYEPRGQGVFIRTLPRRADEGDTALVESVGLIVAATAGALTQGHDVGMRPLSAEEVAALTPAPAATDPPAPEPSPTETPDPVEPSTPAATPRGATLRFVGAYLGDGFNTVVPWQSGARLGIDVGLHRWVRLGLRYAFTGPSVVGGPPDLRLVRHEVAVDTGVGGELGERISLHGVAVVAASLARWRVDGRRGLRPIARVGPMLELGVRLVGGLYLDIGAGALASLNRFAFVVCQSPEQSCEGDQRDVLARGWRLSPRVTVGLSYRLRAHKSRPHAAASKK